MVVGLNMKINMEYTSLEVWIESRKLTNLVYEKTKKFPKEELFGLTNQIRRCSVSIPSNIAEGCGRRTSNDTIQFLHIAKGSLFELEFNEISNQVLVCKKLINGFINYYKKLNNGK